jgi:MoxR-like ATPase
MALLRGRTYVDPHDVESLVEPVLSHRLILAHSYALAGEAAGEPVSLLERCLERAPRPGAALAEPPGGR